MVPVRVALVARIGTQALLFAAEPVLLEVERLREGAVLEPLLRLVLVVRPRPRDGLAQAHDESHVGERGSDPLGRQRVEHVVGLASPVIFHRFDTGSKAERYQSHPRWKFTSK